MHDTLSDRFVRSRLKMRQLVLLVELGRHGSILRAAQAACLTQPAASKLLADLEHALDVPLFERLPRGVLPTPYGEVLIRRAGAALAELDAAHQEVLELQGGLSGTVGVGAVLTPSAGLLPEAIKLLKARHARMRVSVTVDTSTLLTDRLRAGELDIVIGRVHESGAGELHFEPVTDEPHSLIAGAGHPLAGRDGLALDDLAGEPWIMPPAGAVLRSRLTALFLSQGLEPPSDTVEAMALPVIVNLLAGSRMVCALPAELVRPYLDMGLVTVLPYELGLTMDPYGIVTRRQHRLSPGAQAMLATLREVAAQRYPGEDG